MWKCCGVATKDDLMTQVSMMTAMLSILSQSMKIANVLIKFFQTYHAKYDSGDNLINGQFAE